MTTVLTDDGGIKVRHEVTIAKPAGRLLNDEKLQTQLDSILAGVNTGQRTERGWRVGILIPENQSTFYRQNYNYSSALSGTYTYEVILEVSCAPSRIRPTLETEFQNIVNSISVKGNVNKWSVSKIDGKEYQAQALDELENKQAPFIGYAPFEIPADFSSYFAHLYGIDAHINRVKRALEAAELSNWKVRPHVALIGSPGCGKSDLCQSLKRALGDESVMEFDCTSTTMAGAQKEISERDELPRILIAEEIEKTPSDQTMSWLLSVLDLRGEIRKTTARGNILKDVRMLAIATVNDFPTFHKANFGALESRFANKVYFQRPPRELLHKIVAREVGRIDGDPAWIEPALDYCLDEVNTTDPREIIAVTLCGRDQLLTGKYQHDLRLTRAPDAIARETREIEGGALEWSTEDILRNAG